MAFKKEHLRRELGIFQVTIAGVGIILGAGIYALIGIASADAGNATWLSFLISALVALFTGLSYAELSSMFSGDAGEYEYLKVAFHKKYAFFVGLSMIAAGFISAATVALGFAGYFTLLVPMPITVAALLLICLMTIINLIGIKETSWFNTVSTIIEFCGLVIIILLGAKHFGSVNYFEMPHGISGVFSSAALVFFAYMGFESIIKLQEETKNPREVIPRALLYSLAITSVIYVLVSLAAVSTLGWKTLSTSKAPLAAVAAASLGNHAFVLLGIIALFSTANTVLITMVTASRQMYAMAGEHVLPAALAFVHEKTRTPWVAIGVITMLTALFTLIGDIEIVANLTNVFLFLTFASVNASLLVLRYKQPNKQKRFVCPINIGKFSVIALLGLLSSLFMMWLVIRNLM